MDFGDAIRALKNAKRVARGGWNGKGMWLQLVKAFNKEDSMLDWPEDRPRIMASGNKRMRSFIEMKDATDHYVPWLASQTDVLAEDWEVVDG